MRLKLPDNQAPDDGNMLKRRLLGAAVLIAVAVIALPLLLDGAGSESRFRRVEQLRQEPPRIVDPRADTNDAASPSVTPPETTPETVPETTAAAAKPAVAAPATAEVVKPEPAAVAVPTPAADVETPPKAAVQSAPQTDARPAVDPAAQSSEIVDRVAWVIQVGSYAAQANAMALRDRLRTAGYPSFVSKGRNQGAAVFRVKVGPLNNRQQAVKVQSDVESLLGQSTLIRKYPSD